LASNLHKKDQELYNIFDLLDWKPPQIRHIIENGVLNPGNKLQIFGDEGSWKSMLAMHMAYSIATGRKWLGFKTSPCNVFLIQGEMGMLSVRNRNVKYCDGTKRIYLSKPGNVPNEESRATKLAYPPNVYNQAIEFFHLDEQSGKASLRKKLDTVIMESPDLPIVIIVDPLYKVFNHDLNVAREVNYFCNNIDLLLHDYNKPKDGVSRQLAFVFVHHARKAGVDKEGNRTSQGSEDSFGAKQISWWSDCILKSSLEESDKTKTTVRINFTKHGRDAEGFLPELIRTRWNKDTLHPQILARYMPKYPEDDLELRGDMLLSELE